MQGPPGPTHSAGRSAEVPDEPQQSYGYIEVFEGSVYAPPSPARIEIVLLYESGVKNLGVAVPDVRDHNVHFIFTLSLKLQS